MEVPDCPVEVMICFHPAPEEGGPRLAEDSIVKSQMSGSETGLDSRTHTALHSPMLPSCNPHSVISLAFAENR